MPKKQSESTAPVLLSYSCSMQWESMNGDATTRNCEQCSCKVQDISDFSKSQIDALLKQVDAGEEICVAFRTPQMSTVNIPSAELFLPHGSSVKHSSLSHWFGKLSVAVAATIILVYVTPTEYMAAFAKSPTTQSDKLPPAEGLPLCPEQSTSTAVVPTKVSKIMLSKVEHGYFLGRPAPNAIRELVCAVELPPGMELPEAKAFREEEEKGWISPKHLESLAKASEQHGFEGKARKCYSLLIALGKRAHSSPAQIDTYREKVCSLAPKEFADELQQFDECFSKKQSLHALEHLTAASQVRMLEPKLAKELHWSAITSRADRFTTVSATPRVSCYPHFALHLVRNEESSPEIEHWRDSMRELALRSFDEHITAADKALAKKNYQDCLSELETAVGFGSVDRATVSRCNWAPLEARLHALMTQGGTECARGCNWSLDEIKRIKLKGEWKRFRQEEEDYL